MSVHPCECVSQSDVFYQSSWTCIMQRRSSESSSCQYRLQCDVPSLISAYVSVRVPNTSQQNKNQPDDRPITFDASTALPCSRSSLMLRSIEVVISRSRVHERWNNVPFISWSRELVITSGELELGSCTSSSPLVIKDGGGSWCARWLFSCKSIFLQYFNRIQQYFGSLTILDCHYRT